MFQAKRHLEESQFFPPNAPTKFLHHFRYFFSFSMPWSSWCLFELHIAWLQSRTWRLFIKSIHSLQRNDIWYKHWLVEILFHKFLQRSWLSKIEERGRREKLREGLWSVNPTVYASALSFHGVESLAYILDALANHPQMWIKRI